MNYYVIEFKEPGRNPKITLAENGMVMEADNERTMGGTGPGLGTTIDRSIDRATGSAKTNFGINAPSGTTGKAANVDLSALPTAVQKTLKAQAPDATIKGISRHDENGRLVYEFEFADQGKNPTIQISEDGTVVQTLKK